MSKLNERFQDALAYAAELHQAQRRKGGRDVPYVAHLLAVTSLVLEHGGGEDEAIAALLHDAIEDQGGDATRQQIRARFGDQVCAIVDGCTDTETHPKPPWLARKRAHLEHLKNASDSVRLVVAADKLHNLRCLVDEYRAAGPALWSRFRGGRDGTHWYHRSMIELLERRGPAELAAELRRTLASLDRLLAARGEVAGEPL